MLSCSYYVYVEICINMKSDTFVNCHVHAYEYFGGVTQLLIPDNLKTGITIIPSMKRLFPVLTKRWQTIIILQSFRQE